MNSLGTNKVAKYLGIASVEIFQTWMEPVFFYINTVFALHGLLVSSLFAMTWLMSGSWLAGLLTSIFYIINRFVHSDNDEQEPSYVSRN